MKRPAAKLATGARKRRPMTAQRVQIFVTGKVQGVYFRDTTKLMGDRLGLSGAAWNLSDGRVEILAEGPQEKLKELVDWCWKGPEGAAEVGIENSLTAKRKVTDVSATFAEAQGNLPSPFSNAGKK
mmetsp:Transcript_70660/g.165705  ORF Transcript_70660/g.165705 Transcript_70660/m.165705 type:complete len:126 (-) Transcript_70660:217-594(-)